MAHNVKESIDVLSDLPLADDLIEGMSEIARFFGMTERKAYHLASTGLLPGCFMIGRRHFCSKSAARENIAHRAKGGAKHGC